MRTSESQKWRCRQISPTYALTVACLSVREFAGRRDDICPTATGMSKAGKADGFDSKAGESVNVDRLSRHPDFPSNSYRAARDTHREKNRLYET